MHADSIPEAYECVDNDGICLSGERIDSRHILVNKETPSDTQNLTQTPSYKPVPLRSVCMCVHGVFRFGIHSLFLLQAQSIESVMFECMHLSLFDTQPSPMHYHMCECMYAQIQGV